jgi:hypothetical protein
MRTLHKDYFTTQLMEQFEGTGGSSNDLESAAKLMDIVDLLKEAQIKHRKNDEFLKWSYWYLINDRPGYPYLGVANIGNLEIYFDYQKYLFHNKFEIPDRLDDWIEKHCTEEVIGQKRSHVLVGEAENLLDKSWTRNNKYASIANVDELEKLKQWHKISVKTFSDAVQIDIEAVLDFMKNPQWPDDRNALATQNQTPSLEAVIEKLPQPPQIDFDTAVKEASKIKPDDFETIHHYAGNIRIDVAEAIAAISHFGVVACPTPYATLDITSDILENKDQIHLEQLEVMALDNTVGFV